MTTTYSRAVRRTLQGLIVALPAFLYPTRGQINHARSALTDDSKARDVRSAAANVMLTNSGAIRTAGRGVTVAPP
jgi:hypothetical protein